MRKWTVILLLLAVSCVKEKETAGDVFVRFQATSSPFEGATKATPVTSVTGSFGALAYTHATPDGEKTLFASAVEMTPNDGVWTGNLHWPGYGHGGGQAGDVRYVSFYAFAPYSLSSNLNGHVLADVTARGDQDVLVAATGPLDDNPSAGGGTVSLPFRHAFTGVRFQAEEGYTLSDISLTGIYSRGDYDFFTGTWSNQGTATSYTGFVPTGTAPGEMLLLLPQTLPAGAGITMKVSYQGGAPETLTLSDLVAGTTWYPGTMVTYLISQVQYTYEVGVLPPAGSPTTVAGGQEVPLVEVEITEGTLPNAFQINSYKVDEDGVKADVPWAIKAVYSDADLTQPVELEDGYYSWLKDFSGPGGLEESVNLTSKAAPVDHTEYNEESIRQALRSKGSVGSSNSPLNLSNRSADGTYATGSYIRESANCYIVNGPGWYKFPLVVGNGFKNHAPNPSAYSISSTDAARMLGSFPDYLDTPVTVTSPVMNNPRIAAVLWADRQNLIGNYSLYQENNIWWIKFRVTQADIDQGNVVFAALDYVVDYSAGMVTYRVMWSWHIWITDYVPGQGDLRVNSHAGNLYTFMPLSLGWTELGSADIALESTLYVQLETEDGREVGTIAVRKPGGTVGRTYLGRAPTYQWGRKDPIIPGMGAQDYDDISGMVTILPEYMKQDGHDYVVASWIDNTHPAQTMGQSIQSPHVFRQASNGDWCSTSWINRWNAAQSGTVGHGYQPGEDYSIVKTIYDPSPAGYHVPHAMAFSGLTKSGGEATSLNALNLDPDDTSVPAFRGYRFKPDAASDAIDFPIAGYRSYNGDYPLQFNRSGGISYYWSAEMYNRGGQAYALYLIDTRDVKVDPLHPVYTGLGAYVRPVKD